MSDSSLERDSTETGFSWCLNRVKAFLRISMTQERFSALPCVDYQLKGGSS